MHHFTINEANYPQFPVKGPEMSNPGQLITGQVREMKDWKIQDGWSP